MSFFFSKNPNSPIASINGLAGQDGVAGVRAVEQGVDRLKIARVQGGGTDTENAMEMSALTVLAVPPKCRPPAVK